MCIEIKASSAISAAITKTTRVRLDKIPMQLKLPIDTNCIRSEQFK